MLCERAGLDFDTILEQMKDDVVLSHVLQAACFRSSLLRQHILLLPVPLWLRWLIDSSSLSSGQPVPKSRFHLQPRS
jgi:hypothetical protein